MSHIKNMEGMFFGFTGLQLRLITYKFAEVNHIQHQFSRKREAGREWLGCFMSHHTNELSLRTAEAMSAARARAFNEVSVAALFNTLEREQNDKIYTPDRIVNVEEN